MALDIKSEENKSSLTYTIQNIVAKGSLKVEANLDLKHLSTRLENSDYNSDRFPGLFMRFKHPKCVIIIFSNGKLVLTGLKSFKYLDLIIERIVLKLEEIIEIKIDRNSVKYEVVNIVVTADLYKEVNLDLAAITLENVIYEPEVFPGLVYKVTNPVKSVFLIFSTGKIVFTGIRNKDIIESALISLGRLLKKEDLFLSK